MTRQLTRSFLTTARTLCTAVPAVALALTVGTTPVDAQARQAAKLDRTRQPEAGAAPALRVPAWTTNRLPNGAEFVFSQKRGLPLVSVTINFLGGALQHEDPAKLGVAQFTAQMLSEGTTSRNGDQIADAQQLLGTSINVAIGPEGGSVVFTSLADKYEGALELAADMLLNPTFPAAALERIRQQRLVQLTQAKDQPNAISGVVFTKVLYGDEHPYGRVVTEQTVRAITRDDVVRFHQEYFKPGRAVVTVVGDLDQGRARAALEKAFAQWQPGGERPTFQYPPAPQPKPTAIYIVDKPKSAQSVFALGLPGPSRLNPDYHALSLMNTILGGLFQSRLNHLIREVRGYSYQVGSSFGGFSVPTAPNFGYAFGPGAFRAGGAIITAKTDSALIDFMNELRGVQGGKPFTEDEIKQGKDAIVQSLPGRFASVGATNSAISQIHVLGLPENYFQDFAARINLVTSDDLVRVARKYIDLDRLAITIVGDRAVIEEPLRKTGIAPIMYLDIEGKPAAGITP
jgi:zinc protease